MAWECNSARLCGRVEAPPEFSHRNRGVDYYGFPLVTRRLSGAGDRLNVTLPRRLLAALPAPGERIALTGELRSFNNRSGQGNRLLLFVFAQEFAPPEEADRNEAELRGTLCKPPVWRRTPMGREICDMMLSVPRRYGRTDYLPCIAWGALAREVACWAEGTPVGLTGRFQSRNYIKALETGSLQRTAYEISVTSFLPAD